MQGTLAELKEVRPYSLRSGSRHILTDTWVEAEKLPLGIGVITQ